MYNWSSSCRPSLPSSLSVALQPPLPYTCLPTCRCFPRSFWLQTLHDLDSSSDRKSVMSKNWEKAARLTALGGRGGHPSSSLTAFICENVDPFLSYIKLQNNPKYGNLSRNFHIYLTASGEGRGGQPKRSAWPLFPIFFLISLSEKTGAPHSSNMSYSPPGKKLQNI